MTLKARLRIFIVVLMLSAVSALSALNMYSLVGASFDDLLQRANMTLQQVTRLVRQRVREQTAVRNLPAGPERVKELKQAWGQAIKEDQELTLSLTDALVASPVIVEVLVAAEDGRILACSDPTRVGAVASKLPNLVTWTQKSPWGKLVDIFSRRQDYEVSSPLGIPRGPAKEQVTLFNIKVVVASVFMRKVLLPQVQNIVLIFLISLLLSMLLAVVVSNLALRPLDTISQALDRLTRGDFGKGVSFSDSSGKEFIAVQSKLNLLGQQFRGAREDAIQLRTNIEQMLERLEEVVLLFDREDRLVMAGRAAEGLLGRGRWEVMGRKMFELFPATSALGAAVQAATELKQPLKDRVLTLDRNGVPPVRVLVNVEVLESFPNRDRIGTLMTLRDAETRRQIQSQLDISARLAAISRLTGGVAHEIKNPLNAIAVHLEVLRSKLTGDASLEPEIDTIAREITRLDRVVKTFLDFTRPVDLKMRQLDVVALAREVASLVRPSAERQKVEVDIEADPGEIFVHGDRDLLQQAVLNIVVNGVEAMKSGGRLRIGLRQIAGECALNISDEGQGIPQEIRDKIFHLYFSTKGKGSGIGLAMAFRVIQLHNGTIDFTSEPGKGTTFRLRLPSIQKAEGEAASNATTESQTV